MPQAKKPSEKKKITVVDFGFGKGERIRSWRRDDRPERIIWGVERPKRKGAKKKRIKGAHVSYKGVMIWLKGQRNKSIKVVNGDFILNLLFKECLFKNRENFNKLFSLMKRRLVKNGRVYFTVFHRAAGEYIALMGKSKFRLVSVRVVDRECLKTHWIEKHFTEDKHNPPTRLVFRPGEPTELQKKLIRLMEEGGDPGIEFKRTSPQEQARLLKQEYHASLEINRIKEALELLGFPEPKVDLVNRSALEELERLRDIYGTTPEASLSLLKQPPPDRPLIEQLRATVEEHMKK